MEPETVHRKGILGCSAMVKKPNETMRIIITIFVGIIFGFFIGKSFPALPLLKLNITSALIHDFSITGNKSTGGSTQSIDASSSSKNNRINSTENQNVNGSSKIWVPSNPKGAERLPPGIVESESDFYLRRLWGEPSEDLTSKPKYLVTFTVGYGQMNNIDAAVKKFSESFTILLFHYDGRASEWDEFEWSKRAIHTLESSILMPEEFIKLVRKHGLEISQPGLEPNRGLTWQMTKRRGDREVHKQTEEKPGWCPDPRLPPCAAFVEIMAPVFSREAWRCVWHMIQNDLVHGWGLDFALQKCVEPAHEKIGVVDAQWVVHQSVPSLGNQGQSENGKAPWQGVRERCRREWKMFQTRMADAEKSYYKAMGIGPSNFTAHH
ncbi:hypothetical protein Fot_04591 [Forsythia ovata]|uniref:Uncharacterized protein n=1 Tax=Forsythia ovata TaxID=205694 RepID=A0ABD1XD13_9LAMI